MIVTTNSGGGSLTRSSPCPPGTLAVTLESASVVYRTPAGPFVAICGVTGRILCGERLGLIGPSGSGKTTLLHLLAGLEPPAEGTIAWPCLGAAPAAPAAAPGRVTLAFQSASLLGALTVSENVALPLVIAGETYARASKRAGEMLDRLDLHGLRNQLPEELSGGQAQRVGLARAMATEPAILLCDEPTGQLDSATATRILDVLLAPSAEGPAIVVSTHDPAVIERLDTRWDVLDGRVAAGVAA